MGCKRRVVKRLDASGQRRLGFDEVAQEQQAAEGGSLAA